MKISKCNKCIAVILVLFSILLSGCTKGEVYEKEENTTDIQKTTLELLVANEKYISNTLPEIGSNDAYNAEELESKYDFVKTEYKGKSCWIFDISNSNLKLYAFCLYPPNDFICQTVFVDETFLDRVDVFAVGDKIENVKSIYPHIQLLSNKCVVNFAKTYFEILNDAGLYTYGIDENGIIVSIARTDLKTFNTEFLEGTDIYYFN